MRYNPDGSVYPELAESYEISDDGLTYTFKLRDGIKFHDGTVCDSEAIKWNFERQMGENATAEMGCAAEFFGPIVSAETPDPLTFIVTLDAPNSAFIVYCAQRIGMGIASPTAFQADPVGFTRKPVGTGPYKFGEWESDQYFTLVANEDYILGKPENALIIYKIIEESATRTSEMITGGIDLMNNNPADHAGRRGSVHHVGL